MKLLVYTTLFPNSTEPHHGIFVKTRLAHYLARHGGEALVIAPVPRAPPFGPHRWRRWRQVPEREVVDGFTVDHPRYLSPPGFGDGWRARLMAQGVSSCVLSRVEQFDPDVIDVHYAYPDGVAMASLRPRIEAALGRPVPMVLTCRGTDLNLLPSLPSVRPRIQAALRSMDHVICVADALRDVALELGVAPHDVTTLRNGVDTSHFCPGDKLAARARLGVPGDRKILLCVGHLTERKGQHMLLPAFARSCAASPQPWELYLVGAGESEGALRALAVAEAVDHRVHFIGSVAPSLLPDWYRAADAMVLASSREGWPNVVLESLACGTPVIATRVWGTPEILGDCPAGRLVDATIDGLAAGLMRADELDPSVARAWAERHTWEQTVDGMAGIFERLVATVAA